MYDEVSRHTFNILNEEFIVDDKFQLIRIIGNGSYSTICSSRYENLDNIESNGALVAIKKIKNGNDLFDDLLLFKRSLRELFLLKQFRGHPNIVCLYDVDLVFYSNGQLNGLYIYEELLDCDLSQIIQSNQPLTVSHHQSFIYQILYGLKYIHTAQIILRDLKPSNILVTEDCQLKICDFGLSRSYSSTPQINNQFTTEYVSSRWYRAPEIMLTYANYSPAVDIWSLGCILAELIGRQPIFQGMDYVNQLNRILQIRGTPSNSILDRIGSRNISSYIYHLGDIKKRPLIELYPNASDDSLDLLDEMLQYDPLERITVDDALNHPFLSIWHDPEEETLKHEPIEISFEKIDDPDVLRAVLIEEVLDVRRIVREGPKANSNDNNDNNDNDNNDNDNNINSTPTRKNENDTIQPSMDHDSSNSDSLETDMNNNKSLEINQGIIQEHIANNTLAPPVRVIGNSNNHNHDHENSLNMNTITQTYSNNAVHPLMNSTSSGSSSSLEKDLENGLDGKSS